MMGNYHARCGAGEKPEVETPEAYLSLFGKIPEFPQKISTCRKYNISTTIVLQSIAQIKMLYKDDYETIIGNCDTSICLGTNEQTTAEYFSKKLGVGTITTKSSSFQVGKQGGTTSRQQTKRELMLPDEIMTMPFNKCIVMMRGIDPFYDNKYPLENHPQFMNTGDGDKKNFYFLEKDPEFLCVDKTEEYTDDAVADNIDDSPEKLKPKTLEEVLGDLLLNIPEEDGYYLIKDADRSQSEIKKSMFRSIKAKFEEKIKESIEKKEKTAFFDGKEMDVSMLRGMAVKAMRSYGEFINDVAIACDGLSGSGHLCCTAAKDDDCNVVKVMKNMNLQSENKTKDSITDFKVYKIKEELSEDKFDKFKKGCQLGAGTVASAKAVEAEDIDFDDYA